MTKARVGAYPTGDHRPPAGDLGSVARPLGGDRCVAGDVHDREGAGIPSVMMGTGAAASRRSSPIAQATITAKMATRASTETSPTQEYAPMGRSGRRRWNSNQ